MAREFSKEPQQPHGKYLREDGTTLSIAEKWDEITDPFGDVRTANVEQIIELKSIPNQVSELRNATSTTQASITAADGEYDLSLNADGSGSATLDSAERLRYVPGTAAYAGLGVRLPDRPSNNQEARWGYFDDQNGWFFGEDSTGLFVEHRRGGSQIQKIRRSDWNDPVDGTGPSGLNIDLTKGNIWRIQFSWYGYGTINFRVFAATDENRLKAATVVRIKDTTENTSSNNPNLPIRAEADNNSTAQTFDMFVAGRQGALVGDFNPNRRRTPIRNIQRSLDGTRLVPVLSARRKSDFTGTSVKPQEIDIVSGDDLIWEVRSNSSLSDPSFGTPSNVSASETAIEADSSATTGAGGLVLDAGVHVGGTGGQAGGTAVEPIDYDFREDDIVTLFIRKISGTGGTVTAFFKTREEW